MKRSAPLSIAVSLVLAAACCGGGGVATTNTSSTSSLDLHGGVTLVFSCHKPVMPTCRRQVDRLDKRFAAKPG